MSDNKIKKLAEKSQEGKRLLKAMRQNEASRNSPFAGLTQEQAIEKIRETRYRLWEEKFLVTGP